MKIGIDHHGVLNADPFFKEMGKLFVAAGHEVHVITGAQFNDKVKGIFKELGLEKGVHFTHYFSIADYLIEQGSHVTWKDDNNPVFEAQPWEVAKSIYCRQQGIDIHFDDSQSYAEHFTTPIYVKNKKV